MKLTEKEKATLAALEKETRSELENHIIPFWEGMKDEERGGFYGLLGYDLNLDKNAVKGCILNSRILWFFSNAYKMLGEKELFSYAHHAYAFLKEKCLDSKNGGVFWSVNADGSVADSTKHTYNQAFAIYALCSYFEISHDRAALETAFDLFSVIEEKCTDEVGYLEAFTRDFKPESNEKLSENGVMAEKTMNTLLHVLEAYTDLYRMSKDARVKERLHFILRQFESKIWNPEKKRQEVFFDKNLNTLIDLYSYGHDIETSWLLDKCLSVLGEEEYTGLIAPITKTMAEQILSIAYKNHSLLNECEKGKDDSKRIWWVQAESVVGFLNAFQKTGAEAYLETVADIWAFIKEHLIDKRNGSEWFWCTDENGKPEPQKPIVEPWKCPYHNGRMCFEVMERAEKMKDEN